MTQTVPQTISQTRCTIATAHASRYLQQLCKHWTHKFAVTFDPQQGRIAMPEDREITLTASDTALDVVLSAPAGAMAHMQHVIDSHIARFAFREELVFDWQPG